MERYVTFGMEIYRKYTQTLSVKYFTFVKNYNTCHGSER
jgi:hypothetical protein